MNYVFKVNFFQIVMERREVAKKIGVEDQDHASIENVRALVVVSDVKNQQDAVDRLHRRKKAVHVGVSPLCIGMYLHLVLNI